MPKDIRMYKTKSIGPFTIREAVCIILAILTCFFVYNCIMNPLDASITVTVYGCMLISIPFIGFGWYAPCGMPLEQYLSQVLLRYLISPTNRKAEMDMLIKNDDVKNKEKARRKKKKKKNTMEKGFL